MSDNIYSLYGFSALNGKPPQFIEPVFISGNRLYVQAGVSDDNEILNFVEFDDAVDLIEHRNDEVISLGDPCIFAVMEKRGRLIYGDKKYVSRYLSQNLRNYIDTPYFLHDCMEFTGERLPELSFVNNNKDLLELSVATNSIREFISNSPSSRQRLFFELSNNEISSATKLHFWPKKSSAKTIFGEWLTYANKNNHKVASSKRWKNLETSYLKCYNNESIFLNTSIRHHVWSCRDLLYSDDFYKNNFEKEHDEVDGVVFEHLCNSLHNYEIEHKSVSDTVRLSNFKKNEYIYWQPPTEKKEKLLYEFKNWIKNSIRNQTISRHDISLHVYFIVLAIKFTVTATNGPSKHKDSTIANLTSED